MEDEIVFIAGLYSDTSDGVEKFPYATIKELEQSIQLNEWYKDKLICYADSKEMARIMSSKGCRVHKVFDDTLLQIYFYIKCIK